MILEVCLALFSAFLLYAYFRKQNRNLPPGPKGIPFLGSIPINYAKDCVKAREKYGDLIMSRTGCVNFLFIFDFKVAKEALSRLEFADRPHWKIVNFFKEERERGRCGGIISSNGDHWHHNRRFLLRHLRDLGMGKSKIEGIVMREVEDLVEDFKKLTKEPSKLPFSINIAVLNIIWQLVASHRYNFEDEQVEYFMRKIREIQSGFLLMALPDLFPFLAKIIPKPILHFITGRNKFNKMCEEFQDIVQPFIDEHLKTLDKDNPRDLMDDYLIEMKEGKSEDYSHFSLTDLTRITFDLFLAGNDTTSNMIRWFLIYMARFQETQERIQKEIDRVVPRDTLPGLQHRNELAYLDATINEVQRHCSMVSMGVMRCVSSDVELKGYDIPKETVVFSVAAMSHGDPVYWKNPEEFNPSRFLDEKGKFIPTCDGFQAFGMGKRQCLGEQFARMELYLVNASLLQNFRFCPPEGEGPMSISPEDLPNMHMPRRDQKFDIKWRN